MTKQTKKRIYTHPDVARSRAPHKECQVYVPVRAKAELVDATGCCVPPHRQYWAGTGAVRRCARVGRQIWASLRVFEALQGCKKVDENRYAHSLSSACSPIAAGVGRSGAASSSILCVLSMVVDWMDHDEQLHGGTKTNDGHHQRSSRFCAHRRARLGDGPRRRCFAVSRQGLLQQPPPPPQP